MSPGGFVPEFEEAMNSLASGGMSPPVVSRFGVHLIQVIERRQIEIDAKQMREQARASLREQKFDAAYQEWARSCARAPTSRCANRRNDGDAGRRAAVLPMKHPPRKRFGQHFLVDPSVIDAIVRAIDPRPGEAWWRSARGWARSPGRCAPAARLTLIELDRDLAARLRAAAGV